MPVDIVEMFWECTHCKRPNLGRHKLCGGSDGKCSDGELGCGKTKEDSCREWLPHDVSHTSASVVTEATAYGLIGKFKAGIDNKCRSCGTFNWRSVATCANCGRPQNEKTEREQQGRDENTLYAKPVAASRPVVDAPVRTPLNEDDVIEESFMHAKVDWHVPAAIGGGCILLGGLLYAIFHTVEIPATVTGTTWKYVVHVERNEVVHSNGYDPPGDAFNTINEGRRIHHYDRVVDHYDTERYTVRESCGQTCTPVPRVCTNVPQTCHTTSRSCTSNKNGSATCTGGDRVCSGGGQSCSGGGQSCLTKYCTVDKTRQNPVYREDPVYRDFFNWDAWHWVHNRDVPITGTDANPHPPSSDQVALKDHERTTFDLGCNVVFTDDNDQQVHTYSPRGCDSEFLTLSVGTKKTIMVNSLGTVEIKTKK